MSRYIFSTESNHVQNQFFKNFLRMGTEIKRKEGAEDGKTYISRRRTSL